MAREQAGTGDKIAMRTAELAEQRGELASLDARNFLASSLEAEIISPSQAEAIVAQKRQEAIDQYIAERNAGLHNDIETGGLQTGLKAWVLAPERERIEETLRQQGVDLTLHAPVIEAIEGGGESAICMMQLPLGFYTATSRGITFYTDAGSGSDYLNLNDVGRFRVSPNNVVRIEGDGGELWQNPELLPNGVRHREPYL